MKYAASIVIGRDSAVTEAALIDAGWLMVGGVFIVETDDLNVILDGIRIVADAPSVGGTQSTLSFDIRRSWSPQVS